MELNVEGTKQLIKNIKEYQALDPANDDEFKEMMKRLRGLSMMLDDILVSEGEREPLTSLEKQARTINPFYQPVAILPSAGRSPKRSGKKG